MSMYLPNPEVAPVGAEPGEFLELTRMADVPVPPPAEVVDPPESLPDAG